jgi:hypothetical protein
MIGSRIINELRGGGAYTLFHESRHGGIHRAHLIV